MHPRQGRHHAAVSLIGDQRDRTRLGNQEIAARNAHVGKKKMGAQDLTCLACHCLNVCLRWSVVRAREERRDFFLTLVKNRRDDVRRRFVAVDLKNVLAEIGFDGLNTGCLKRTIERRLFREHGLGLDRFADTMATRNLDRQPADFVTVSGPQHRRTTSCRLRLKTLQPEIEIIDDPVAQRLRRIAQGGEVVDRVELSDGMSALADKLGLGLPEILLKDDIGHFLTGTRLEMHRANFHVSRPCLSEPRQCVTPGLFHHPCVVACLQY